jgi:RNA polymerase sigma factor (sigma-70 family)
MEDSAMTEQRFLTIDGAEVAVTEEVYLAYKRPAWAERKRKKVRKDNELSFELFTAEGYEIASSSKSLESAVEDKLLIAVMNKALELLPTNEYDLIHALYYKGVTVRVYAQQIGTNHTKVIRERERILKKLKNYF